MNLPPIVDRELRVASRRHGTYWRRQSVAVAAMVIGALIFLANLRSPGALVAQRIFIGLTVLSMLYGLTAGRLFTSDCLSAEKRDGTLGLLFLTDLKGFEVVLGKLAATSLSTLYGLVAMVPVLAVPLLMGGIGNGEFWRVVLVLVNTILLSLAIGIFVSALCRNARTAAGANFLVLLLFLGALPACAMVISYHHSWSLWIQQFFFLCPVYSCYLAFDISYLGQRANFWWSVAATHALTWLLVALASWIVPRAWQDRASGASRRPPLRERWRTFLYGPHPKRAALRRRLLAVNPFTWLALRMRFKPASVWLVLGMLAGWWVYLRLQTGPFSSDALGVMTAVILDCLLKLWIAVETVQTLAESRQSGALELLLSTPLNEREIVVGQFLALRRQFLLPLLAVAVIQICSFVMARISFPAEPFVAVSQLAALAMLLCDIAAVFFVGMSASLTSRSPNYASVNAITRVMILPWVVFGAISALVLAWYNFGRTEPPGWKFFLALWLVAGLAADFAFGVHAWWRLRTRFRELALPVARLAKT